MPWPEPWSHGSGSGLENVLGMAGKIGGEGLIFEAAAFRDLNSDTEASSKRHGMDVLSKTSRPNSATPPTPNGLSSPIELGPLFLARPVFSIFMLCATTWVALDFLWTSNSFGLGRLLMTKRVNHDD